MNKFLLISLLCVNFAHGMKKDHPAYHHYHNKIKLPTAGKLVRSPEIEDLRAARLSEIDHARQIHNHSIDIESQQLSPAVQNLNSPEVLAANITAHSSTKVACIALGAALASSAITAGVVLAIHFTSCN